MKICMTVAAVALFALGEIDKASIVDSKEVVALLNRGQELAECGMPKCDLHVRVFRVSHTGECDGSPATCPLSSLYVAVSQYDEAPEQVAFRFADAHEWEFVRWLDPGPRGILGERSARFELRAKRPAPDPKVRWWDAVLFTATVDLSAASLVEN